jgi:hypothetical protein
LTACSRSLTFEAAPFEADLFEADLFEADPFDADSAEASEAPVVDPSPEVPLGAGSSLRSAISSMPDY